MDSSQLSTDGQASSEGHDLQSAIKRLGVQQAAHCPLCVEAHDPQGQLIAGVYGWVMLCL